MYNLTMRNDAGLHRLLLPILSLFISISMVSCYSNEAKGPALEDGVVERMTRDAAEPETEERRDWHLAASA